MAFCSKCGNEATGRESYCSFCGFPLLDETQVSAVAGRAAAAASRSSGAAPGSHGTGPAGFPAGGFVDKLAGGSVGPVGAEDLRGDLATFIGKNAQVYLNKFEKFNDGAGGAFAFTWHWPAFLFSTWWFLYRKMYLWAAVAFMAEMLFGILASIVFGLIANYVYYKHGMTKIWEVRADRQANPRAVLTLLGGVHTWVIPLALILGVITFGLIFIAVLLASLMGPSVPVTGTSI